MEIWCVSETVAPSVKFDRGWAIGFGADMIHWGLMVKNKMWSLLYFQEKSVNETKKNDYFLFFWDSYFLGGRGTEGHLGSFCLLRFQHGSLGILFRLFYSVYFQNLGEEAGLLNLCYSLWFHYFFLSVGLPSEGGGVGSKKRIF